MRYLAWFVRIVLFLLLFAFAIKNTHAVNLHGLLDLTWQAPLVVILLVFFMAGTVAGVLAMLLPLKRLGRELHQSRAQVRRYEIQTAARHTASHIEPSEPLDAVV
ncbi:LapA family protein [Chitinimonas arctica]|nr:lipopolysaccharide assembly protein LapA domain-containing protein [Chitinimonas arctica]